MDGLEWMSWVEVPWLQRSAPQASLIRLCERIAACRSAGEIVSELGAEFGVSNVALMHRQEDWRSVAERGSNPSAVSSVLLAEVVDRDAGVWKQIDSAERVLIVPVPSKSQHVIVLSGPHLSSDQLPDALAAARIVGRLVDQLAELESAHEHVDRLRTTLQIARSFAGERDTTSLLERIAQEATRLLGCDRASIFIWDRDQHQLVACPALGVPGGRLWLPDNKGIIGEIIQSRQPTIVDDAYADSRFDQSVDKKSGYHTRNLLGVPLFSAAEECIGAFELINKTLGRFSSEDVTALEEFGIQAATAITNTQELEILVRNNQQLNERVSSGVQIVGQSPAIHALRGTIERLAATDLPVLILGESGTGKEVAAQSLHYHGPRCDHPFVAINCAALTETLLESELFGHEKGAFTDAHTTHTGKFELAEGGTLFLDEIGDMSLGGQAKLLRVLEQKVITRVGGTQPIPVNVRVIAATNANLAEKVREKEFRQDLYYRLSVVTVDIPPLRERPEDVLPLARFFLERFCTDASRKLLSFTPESEKRMQMHGWPGNVRELRNLMERVAFLSTGDRVEVEDLAFILSPKQGDFDDLSAGLGLGEATCRFQREYIRRAVQRMGGNMSEAAEFLGLHRSNLYRKMRQLDLEVDDVKT